MGLAALPDNVAAEAVAVGRLAEALAVLGLAVLPGCHADVTNVSHRELQTRREANPKPGSTKSCNCVQYGLASGKRRKKTHVKSFGAGIRYGCPST